MTFLSKEKFLEEHNRLSSSNLQTTLALLNRFKEEKKPLIKDNEWCLDKHRIPLISWLSTLPKKEKEIVKPSNKKEEYKNYPETHYEA